MKNWNIFNVIEDVLIATGITISLADLQSVLSIIVLSVQVILIIVKLFIKLKNSKTDKEKIDHIDATIDEIKKIDKNKKK